MTKKLNFTFQEFFDSETAKKNKIDNSTSNPIYLTNWMNLVVFCLQPIREKLNKALNIVSAYRCEKLNLIVGGSNTSQHSNGMAADLSAKSMTKKELFEFIINMYKNNEIEFDQLIWEQDSNCVHISYNTAGNRKQILIRYKLNGKLVYENYKI